MSDLYLGLDLSTQQLKCVIINGQFEIVHTSNVMFDDLGLDNESMQNDLEALANVHCLLATFTGPTEVQEIFLSYLFGPKP